jgi:hypothetical protein
VAILTAPGFAITEIDGGGGHTYRRVRVGSHGRAGHAGGEGYLVGANADAFHSADVAAGPLLEGCDFSGNCDDFANVHSTLPVLYGLGGGGGGAGEVTARVIDPRLVALGATPLAGRVDMWYGTSSPMANARPGDTLSCFYPNTKSRGRTAGGAGARPSRWRRRRRRSCGRPRCWRRRRWCTAR